MPKWEMVKLGDVFLQIRNGASIKQETSAGGIPITRIETIASGEINLNKLGYANISDNKFSNFYLANGDILMSHINSIKHLGKVALYEEILSSTPIIHGMNLLCLKSNILYPKFSLYFFRSVYFKKQIPNITKKSVNQASFTVTALKELKIPLPSLEEQKKIAQELDNIQSLIAKRKEQLEKMDLLVKAKFVEMFGDPVANPMGWEVKKLKDIAKVKIGPFGSLLHKEDYVFGQHALVNPSHIIDSKICIDEKLSITPQKYEELSPYHLKKGDIVLGRRGEMGRCAVVEHDGLLCGTGSVIISVNNKIRADILQKIISYPTMKKIIENVAVGVTMKNLNVPIVSNFIIPLPSMEAQAYFADYVQQTETLKTTMHSGLEKLELLYNSKMQEYFG